MGGERLLVSPNLKKAVYHHGQRPILSNGNWDSVTSFYLLVFSFLIGGVWLFGTNRSTRTDRLSCSSPLTESLLQLLKKKFSYWSLTEKLCKLAKENFEFKFLTEWNWRQICQTEKRIYWISVTNFRLQLRVSKVSNPNFGRSAHWELTESSLQLEMMPLSRPTIRVRVLSASIVEVRWCSMKFHRVPWSPMKFHWVLWTST